MSNARHARIGSHQLEGTITVPGKAVGLVIFAHGSGSSRLSPRNTRVAQAFSERRLATLLFDLLTEDEAADRANVFDIPLLGSRVVEAIGWARADSAVGELPIGLFGASTGAAAALVAAADCPDDVAAVVSRGGRPDLAAGHLPRVRAPVLLVVGEWDHEVIRLNAAAARALRCPHELSIVAGATHLFEEPGTLDQVIELAGEWFARHLGSGQT